MPPVIALTIWVRPPVGIEDCRAIKIAIPVVRTSSVPVIVASSIPVVVVSPYPVVDWDNVRLAWTVAVSCEMRLSLWSICYLVTLLKIPSPTVVEVALSWTVAVIVVAHRCAKSWVILVAVVSVPGHARVGAIAGRAIVGHRSVHALL